MKFAKYLCSALLLTVGGLGGCDSDTTPPGSGTGGSPTTAGSGDSGARVPGTVGGVAGAGGTTTSATGGTTPETGGATSITSGASGGSGSEGAGKGGTLGTGGPPGMDGGMGSAGRSASTTGGAAGADGGVGDRGGMGGTSVGNDASVGGRTSDGGADSRETGLAPDATPMDSTKKITVWMVGDSTMQNCASSGTCGWASKFQQYLGSNATVSNEARGGRSIQTWIWGDPNVSKDAPAAGGECKVINTSTYSDNWTKMLNPTTGMKPGDWVYIAFGINDASSSCNRHVGKALYQSDLSYLAKTIRERGANPIFGTPTSGQSCSASTNVANRGFGPETKAAGTAENVPVVDLTQLSVALYNSLKLCPGGSSTFWADGTHFKAEGATAVAGVVAKALKDQGIGLAAYLK